MLRFRYTFCLLLAASLLSGASVYTSSLKAGKADLKSAGPLAFGPEGILFVGDPMGAAIFALDTGDQGKPASGPVDIQGIDGRIAAMLGTAADQILLNDVVVNPLSRKVYISVSRGRGPDAVPMILRVDRAGKIQEVSLAEVRHSKVMLPNAPDAAAKDRGGQPKRLEAITDLAFVDGNLIVAGLSNEEFASNLRSIPFPFRDADRGANIEIYHSQHGRFETASPVRTFVPYKILDTQHILAAYTCTPLVKFPVADLKPGKKVMGTTIAELGNRNRPLDMIVYSKGGKDYILMNNSSRGVMKISTEKIDSYPGITQQVEKQGLPYETIAGLKDVQQLDKLDDSSALLLVRSESGSLDLKTIALP
ncbi:MAG: hypothetical protein HY013_09375 [Candidatus Solibacter usitatus]|nr:hypothetical protein [Candidatus Solibacter usitatus]